MPKADKALDLIAIGRSSIDLYGQQIGCRLEDVSSFVKYIGGSPTNTAIGAARLGLRTALITRVGNDHMGRFIREQLEREDVSTRGVIDDNERLTALVILGVRDRDTFPLIFYRENCADMALVEADIDEDFIASAEAVLVSGTHLSRPSVFDASMKAIKAAKAAGGRVAFDIDYRPVLWGLTAPDAGENRFVAHEPATAQLQRILPLCDLIVGTEEEIHILGGDTDTIKALRTIRSRTDALIVCKRGPQGCSAFPAAIPDTLDGGVVGRGFPVEVFNVLGAGDAFMGGFLRGWIRDEPLEFCCELGNAAGAIVVSRHGCAPASPTFAEMKLFLAEKNRPFQLREWRALQDLHWSTTRWPAYTQLTVLAMDHRSQFEELAEHLGADPSRIAPFKELALRAVESVAQGDDQFGILLDSRYGADALAEASGHPYWIGRPIELPGSRPLRFEGSPDVGAELATWPWRHVVKCLVFYHPDDEPALRDDQEAQLLRLADASRKTGHELLLEVIVPKGAHVDSHTVARALERLYNLGIRPDWWKLEPSADAEAWRNIEAVIRREDPLCRGVVLLGLSAPMEELVASFEVAAAIPIVRGFAVGRTIFYDIARDWLSNKIDNAQATAALSEGLTQLVDAWRRARGKNDAVKPKTSA
jgi:5-dehydro-2-deoxygluconokinase